KITVKLIFPLLLYYDDFETENPLGLRASVHKLGGLYYTIAGIPKYYASSLENIFLGELLYSRDRETFGNKVSFKPIINELIHLEMCGITICVDNKEHQIFFSLVALLGDNLGLNDLLGFNKSFSANFCCRVCRSSKLETKFQFEENMELLRTVSNYEKDYRNCNYGIKEKCVFNELYFSLKVLNSRIKYFNHTCNIDVGNSIPPIILHYARKIKDFGPLRYLSSIRFEAFHKLSKTNARLVNSRINIVFTLSLNLQLKFAHRILSKKGFDPKIVYGRYVCKISNLPE
ncbi:hypothetical protein ALC62_04128, partial [Cyphomyrmex costatus]